MPYLNVTEVESGLAAAAAPPNSAFTQLFALPNLTWEGRQCHAIKIANGSGPGRMGVYFLGGVHSREWGSPDILINFTEQVCQSYRTNTSLTCGSKTFTAAEIQSIVDKLDIFVFPQANPDGRNHSMTSELLWRKNRRAAPAGNPTCPGVDVNRNYDWMWNYPTYFSPASPVVNSTAPCSDVYIGPGAVSEPETQNVVWLLDNHSNISFFIDLHSYGQDILCTWGDDDDQTTDPNMNFMNPAYNGQRGITGDALYKEFIPSCDHNATIDLANAFAASIAAVRGKSYLVEPSVGLYPTAGTSDDYCYSRHFVDKAKQKVMSYTLEWGTEFQPPYAEMSNIIQDITSGLIGFCLHALSMQADVYIRDNPADTGAIPSSGVFWESSDIFVRNSDDNVLSYQPAIENTTNYVYVQIKNIGPATTADVQVNCRVARFPGTEFVYPQDWSAIDGTHIAPTPMANTFTSIAPGDTRVAKFSLSPGQVNVLYGWDMGGWHPCILAECACCNDYGAPAGPHVWQNNNLAQRNITVVMAALEELIKFPFLVGNVLDASERLELVIDRSELPRHIELVADMHDPRQYFRHIPPWNSEPPRSIPTYAAVEEFELEVATVGGGVAVMETRVSRSLPDRNGEDEKRSPRHKQIAHPQETIYVRKAPGEMRQVVLRFRIPSDAKSGDVYRVRAHQRSRHGGVAGGVTLEVHVK